MLIGNLTRDIELRYTPSGQAIAKLGLAVSRNWRDKNSGEMRQETMFIDCDVFGRSAEVANQYLSKGKRVLIEGRLKLDQWEDNQTGQKRSKHSVVVENFQFIEPKAEGNNQNSGFNNSNNFGGGNQGGNSYNNQQGGYGNQDPFNQPPQQQMAQPQQQNSGFNPTPMPSLSEPSQADPFSGGGSKNQNPFDNTSTSIEDDEIPF